MSLIPVLGRQRQVDLCDFKAGLLYTASFRTARATQEKPSLKKKRAKLGCLIPLIPALRRHLVTSLRPGLHILFEVSQE